MRKASLGSIEFITSLFKSEDESKQIKDAVNASLYGKDFVHAALSVDHKVSYSSYCLCWSTKNRTYVTVCIFVSRVTIYQFLKSSVSLKFMSLATNFSR